MHEFGGGGRGDEGDIKIPHVTISWWVGVGTLANGYIKSVPLPRVTARAAHVTAATNRCQALTPVPYGLRGCTHKISKNMFFVKIDFLVMNPIRSRFNIMVCKIKIKYTIR